MSEEIVAIVLAAGKGVRFGTERFKLLEDFCGKPLLRHAVDAALASCAGRTLVVTGSHRERVEAALAGSRAALIYNPRYAEGISSSLCAGLAHVGRAAGALVLLADMPLLTSATLDRLIAAFREGAVASVPTRSGRRGNPILLGRELFPRLLEIRGDRGARDLLRACDGVVEVETSDDGVLADVDTRDDLARLRGSALHYAN